MKTEKQCKPIMLYAFSHSHRFDYHSLITGNPASNPGTPIPGKSIFSSLKKLVEKSFNIRIRFSLVLRHNKDESAGG